MWRTKANWTRLLGGNEANVSQCSMRCNILYVTFLVFLFLASVFLCEFISIFMFCEAHAIKPTFFFFRCRNRYLLTLYLPLSCLRTYFEVEPLSDVLWCYQSLHLQFYNKFQISQPCNLNELRWTPMESAEQPGPHTFMICTRGRKWTLGLILKMHFSEHGNTGPLNCCKVSSHTHPTLLSHWVQTAFVTSTQQGFPLALVSTQHLVVGCQHY